jgi:hypothetical protein
VAKEGVRALPELAGLAHDAVRGASFVAAAAVAPAAASRGHRARARAAPAVVGRGRASLTVQQVHSTDTAAETMAVAQLLLSPAARHFLGRMRAGGQVGCGRIAALHHRASTLYKVH